jgi:hypothetical protein
MRYVHHYRPMPPEKRPQDPTLDGRGLKFETLEYGGEQRGLARRCASIPHRNSS